ncbi:C-C motif chemokine 4 homolog [Clarias gariepinus]|uniref:C-C motif chemokine 4 homolog n=1 Tax=Clarias gariepinus TaxID=13013 RepID=UPI00234D958C|nr:C-C motif chemokine 4 homolog [Clarias gariepinus]
MSSYSLLMVLLVLTCLQSFTMTQSAKEPEVCCFNFQEKKIPLHRITKYRDTRHGCTEAGVIFIMKNGRRLCANPRVQWVKEHMDKIDQRVHKTSN